MIRTRIPPLERFERHYIPEPNSGCWIWLGATSTDGYPILNINNRTIRVCRFVYLEVKNQLIPPKYEIRHTCDFKLCVNPEHLLCGTHSENMRDNAVRGLIRKALKVSAHLTAEDVIAIRQDKRPYKEIQEQYRITKMIIANIKNRHSWNHLS